MTATVFIKRSGLGATISFRYDPALVELIKTLPSFGRSYDKTSRSWIVRAAYVDHAVRLFRSRGCTVIDDGAQRRDSNVPPPRSAPAENWADALMKAVGSDRVEPVHRALTRVLHPDVGGTNELMSQLKAARDRLGVGR